ncbi:MAG: 4a-hydroxytetrahydrobiopterin dehydratase [Armatimonadetes bacterium]|nr:4a-hydroxytetrahydrobiopterin dehydratase [Armatimonadota bacterium]MDW8122978.1 4a-hydroxytetrahydrobiopterin dehydratase [Armatimonadota bacterium]
MTLPIEDKTPVSEEELAEALQELEGWVKEGRAITRRFLFDKWGDITKFMLHLAKTIEETNHHPDAILDTTTRTVTVSVTTHSAGTVTRSDVEFARRLNRFKPEQ